MSLSASRATVSRFRVPHQPATDCVPWVVAAVNACRVPELSPEFSGCLKRCLQPALRFPRAAVAAPTGRVLGLTFDTQRPLGLRVPFQRNFEDPTFRMGWRPSQPIGQAAVPEPLGHGDSRVRMYLSCRLAAPVREARSNLRQTAVPGTKTSFQKNSPRNPPSPVAGFA